MEVLSLVNFDYQDRVEYLHKSFKSFYAHNKVKKHIVIDGSLKIGNQKEIYEELKIQYYHKPESFAQRLKFGVDLIADDYFVFLPDDYEWLFNFPTEEAIKEARENNIKELKLVCPPMQWFSHKNPQVETWFNSDYMVKDIFVPTRNGNHLKRILWNLHTYFTKNEILVKKGNLFISTRHFRRSFQQQFSLGCHIIETDFLKKLCKDMPKVLISAGQVEKNIYKQLLFNSYLTAYYQMLTPAFHFIDLKVEGADKFHIESINLLDENKQKVKEITSWKKYGLL